MLNVKPTSGENLVFLENLVDVITGAIEVAEDKINDPQVLENGKNTNGIESPKAIIDGNAYCVTREIVDGLVVSSLRSHFRV